MQQNRINIGKRLTTVAETAAVRLSGEKNPPSTAIDVGTDHAKLPMSLVSDYGFSKVTATDINEGPCLIANTNIARAGAFFAERISVVKTNGLCGLEKLSPDRIIIAGMGGELIVDILSAAEFVRKGDKKIGLVLQPQSKEQLLRRYLYSNGYDIISEKRVVDSGKLYCVICASFDGIKRKSTLLEEYFGKTGLCNCDELLKLQLMKKYALLKKNISARQASGEITTSDDRARLFCEEAELLKQIEAFINQKPEVFNK